MAERLLRLDPPPDLVRTAEFRPDIHPRQMLALGIHEGHGLLWILEVDRGFPQEWMENLRLSRTGAPDFGINHFGVGSGRYDFTGIPPDPHGWLQWYLRYSAGRRIPWSDERAIALWDRASTRLRQMVEKNGGGNPRQGRVLRQRLLEWACDPYFDCREGASDE